MPLRVAAILFLFVASTGYPPQSSVPKDALKVRIDGGKKFHVGEPLQFSMTITNVGSQSFLVPNRVSLIDNTMSILNVDLRTQAGQPVPPGLGIADDCAEYKPTKLRIEDVLADYVLLRPGTSYVQQFSLDEVYPKVEPGKYLFAATYVAYFAAKGCAKWTQDDIDKFLFRPWYGSTAANDISFEVLPNPKKK